MLLLLAVFGAGGGEGTARGENFADDFETLPDGNLKTPNGWHPILDATHPAYNVTRIYSPYSLIPARSGKGSCRFTTAGENTALETDAYIAVIPARRYVLKVAIRTAGLINDRATVSVHWLDKTGIPVEVAHTPPLGGTADWTPFEMVFEDIPEQVRFARLRLNLEGYDIEGSCWFDALSLEEHLRLRVRAPGHPGFLFVEGEPTAFEVVCPSLGPGNYTVGHVLLDAHGATALPPRTQPCPVDTDGLLRLRLNLAPPGTGAYRLSISLLDPAGTLLAAQMQPLGVLARERGAREENEFGVVVDPTDPTRELGPPLVRALGTGKAKILIWSKGLSRLPEASRQETVDRLVETYRSMGMADLVGVLASPPPRLTTPDERIDVGEESEEDVLSWFQGPSSRWDPPLRRLLERYKSILRHWQIGGEGDAAIGSDATAGEMFPSWRASVQEVLRFPSLGVPAGLRGADGFPESLPLGFVGIVDDPSVSPLDLPAQVAPASSRKRFATLSVPARERGEPPEKEIAALAEFFRRLTILKQIGVDAIFLSPLAADGQGLLDQDGAVTAAYCGSAAYAQALGGATWDARPFLSDRVTHRVFRSPTRRVIVCWHEGQPRAERAVLGDGAVAFDVAGTRSLLPVERGVQTIAAGPEPVLVVVRDLALFDTQISIDFTGKTLDSRSGPQERFLTITNAYPIEIRHVSLRLTVPEGWGEVPEIRLASLAPGESRKERVTFFLPPSATLGPKEVRIDARFTADRTWELPLLRTLTVTSDINVEIQVRDDPSKKLVHVLVKVTNRSPERVSARCHLAGPGLLPREDTLLNLLPDQPPAVLSRILRYQPGIETLRPADLIRFMLRDGEHRRFVNAEAAIGRPPDAPAPPDRR